MPDLNPKLRAFTHALRRTSPFGEKFLGDRVYCGLQNLQPSAVQLFCVAAEAAGKTQAIQLADAIQYVEANNQSIVAGTALEIIPMATPNPDFCLILPSSSLIPHSMIIRVLNPNPYAHVRAIITTEELFRTNNVFASIYLDINNSFGCADQPYFEVYYPFAHATYGTYRYLYSEQSTMWSDLIASFNTFILGGRTISYTADRP